MLGLEAVRATAWGCWPGLVATTLAAGTPFWKARAPTNTARATIPRKASPTRLWDWRRATAGDATGGTPRFGGHPECAQLTATMGARLELWWLWVRGLPWRRIALVT